MILDKQNLFSEDQAVTATAVSTNIIDLGAVDSAVFNPREIAGKILCQVTEDFATLTSLKVSLYTDGDEAFGSATLLYETAAIAAASLKAGYKFAMPSLPVEGVEQYLRLTYTVAGSSATAGKIVSGLLLDVQTGV